MGGMTPKDMEFIDGHLGLDARGWSDPDGLPWNGMFVKSQFQLTYDTLGAKGHKLKAAEVLRDYGAETLRKILDRGRLVLPATPAEPSAAIRHRRELLEVTAAEVAREIGVSPAEVERAETPGAVSPVRTLEKIAQHLGLDDRFVGMDDPRGADEGLGKKLRTLRLPGSRLRTGVLRPSTVLRLAEAAWVIARQASLPDLSRQGSSDRRLDDLPSRLDVSRPAYREGYDLARETRSRLAISDIAPIGSMRGLLEEELGIPLLQQHLPVALAGATLSNGGHRGIVVNLDGRNRNVWVRRMTVAHELCHYLWDADRNLDRLRVDTYDDLNSDFADDRVDPVEQRANAFAAEFLAPRSGVKRVAEVASERVDALARIMDHFGISATAAGHQLDNSGFVPGWAPSNLHPRITPSVEWVTAENFTADIFPIHGISPVRTGRFAILVAAAYKEELLSSDTAEMMLACSKCDLDEHLDAILELAPTSQEQGPAPGFGSFR